MAIGMKCEIQLLLQIVSHVERKWFALMFIISYHYGKKCLRNVLQIEPCNVMFKAMSDIMAHWYDLWNTIVIVIYFCNGKKMICALILIISYHKGTKCLSNLLQLE